MMATQSLPKSK